MGDYYGTGDAFQQEQGCSWDSGHLTLGLRMCF